VTSRVIKVKVEIINRNRRLRLITLTETLIILDTVSQKLNLIIVLLYIERKKNRYYVFASLLIASNTKHVTLT